VTEQVQVAVLIPAYNEAATIRDIVARALAQASPVIVIDDGSLDGTGAALHDLPITLLVNERNLGKAASLWRGMQHALALGAERIVTLDGDGQHRPEDLPRLMQVSRAYPHDIIIGARLAGRHSVPRLRDFANRVANFFISCAAGYRIADSQSGFRLYPAALLRLVDVAHGTGHGFVFESEILIAAARLGVCSRAVVIDAIYLPGARGSHYRPVIDTLRIARMVAVSLCHRALAAAPQEAVSDCVETAEHHSGQERS
jgi:glycosyltransferase involved in cell wall biosynthesis